MKKEKFLKIKEIEKDFCHILNQPTSVMVPDFMPTALWITTTSLAGNPWGKPVTDMPSE